MKILLDRKDRVIGTQIVGYHAGELLAPALYSVGKSWKASAIMSPIYPYPTLSELHKKTVSGYMGPATLQRQSTRHPSVPLSIPRKRRQGGGIDSWLENHRQR